MAWIRPWTNKHWEEFRRLVEVEMGKRRCVVRRATAEEELERLAVCEGGVM